MSIHCNLEKKLLASGKLEYCIANTVFSTKMEMYQCIFMKCLGAHAARYNTRSLMALDITL